MISGLFSITSSVRTRKCLRHSLPSRKPGNIERWAGLFVLMTGFTVSLFCVGCSAPAAGPAPALCPPPQVSKNMLIDRISRRQSDLIEFAAKGSAVVNLYSQDRTETLNNVTAYFSDENNVVIRVGHTFGTAMVLGSNEQRFWCLIDFSDINEFYTGTNSLLKNCGAKGLKTFPVAEAFGIIDTAELRDALMFFEENEYGFDIYDEQNTLVRSYAFDNCTAMLSRITYYDDGGVSVVARFSDFRPLNGQMNLPAKTKIFSVSERLELEFETARFIPINLNDAKRQKLYKTPTPPSDADIYNLTPDCLFMEQ
jgi:hypothetical protein